MLPADAALLLLLLLGARATPTAAQDDFSLEDALGEKDTKPTPRPPPERRKPPSGDLDLTDALGGGADEAPGKKPRPDPKPLGGGDSGGFSDRDLEDVSGRGGGARGGGGGEAEGQPQGLIPGVVAAVVAAVTGAVSTFIAYQRRRLCFREGGSAPV